MKRKPAASTAPVVAKNFMRRVRGGSQSVLIRASDGHCYIVKSKSNPQGRRCIINDYIATLLAEAIGLPIPPAVPVAIDETFVMENHLFHRVEWNVSCWPSGLQFGSRTPVDPDKQAMYDYIPVSLIPLIANIDAALGSWLFDVWTCNRDIGQAVFYKKPRGQRGKVPYAFKKVDHGFCFGGGKWRFDDLRRKPCFWQQAAMAAVRGFESFEPYWSRIKNLSFDRALQPVASVPAEWWQHEAEQRQCVEMLTELHRRARRLKTLVRKCWPFELVNAGCKAP